MRNTALALVGLVAFATALPGCRRRAGGEAAASSSASAAAPTLPPLTFRDDTANALLTWVDAQGNFHVVEHVTEVPEDRRDAVRVVVAGKTEGTGEAVYVADLRNHDEEGAYPVHVMQRSEWDERGAGLRKARLEALAPSAAPPPEASSAAGARSHPPGKSGTATIYGASWCGPCHQAQSLLQSLGVAVVMKDIEQTPGAQEEMQAVLRRVRRQGGSIPVIDVGGQVLVGFSDGALRAAVQRMRAATL